VGVGIIFHKPTLIDKLKAPSMLKQDLELRACVGNYSKNYEMGH
jgi:hypothetical protein